MVERGLLLAMAGCVAAGWAPAQTLVPPRALLELTDQTLIVGDEASAAGCQLPGVQPPRLSDGTKASGQLTFSYSELTHILTVVVENDSEVVHGVANPVITQVAFNLPLGAVLGADLVSQTALAGAPPSFRLQVDPSARPQFSMGCLGHFGLRLRTSPTGGAIGNPAAGTLGVPAATVALGAKFEIRLTGPGVDFISARTVALGFSQNATLQPVNAACRFDAGGPTGLGQGFISAVEDPTANGSSQSQPTIWITTRPAQHSTQTTRFELCVGAQPGLHGCLLGSPDPGPTSLAGFSIPVGVPTIQLAIPVMPPTGRQCFGIQIPPPPPILAGLTTYFAFVTLVPVPAARQSIPAPVESTPRFDLKIE